jgi:flagella basal body P-ring formation protein FlgA
MMSLVALLLAAACWPVAGDHILGRDVAAAVPALAALPPEDLIGLAPAPGAWRTFSAAELQRLAHQHAIDSTHIAQAVCFEIPMEALTRQTVEKALAAALAGQNPRLEILDWSRVRVPHGAVEFPRTGLIAAPPPGAVRAVYWRGRVKYAARRSFPIWVQVKIAIPGVRLVAASPLVASKPIESSQLKTEPCENWPFAEVPLSSPAQAVGKVPRRSLRAGQPIMARDLADPPQVERGQTVRVAVQSGGAQLSLDARVETAGRAGERVTVRNPATGRRFAARVESPGHVAVEASGGRNQ